MSVDSFAREDAGAPPSTIPPISGVVSGMRPVARDASDLDPSVEGLSLSGLALTGVLAWLLALTMVAVDALHADFTVSLVIAALQAALIAAFFMRLGWDKRTHLLLVGVGAFVLMLLLMAISVDRSEYQPDLERWGITGEQGAPE